MNATTLTLERILFGDPNRDCPDPIDKMIYHEIVKAGPEGTTMLEVAEHLLCRKLTAAEIDLVYLADEMTEEDREEEE